MPQIWQYVDKSAEDRNALCEDSNGFIRKWAKCEKYIDEKN